MRFVVAGGGFAGLAAALAVARAGHEAVVLERDDVRPSSSPEDAFTAERRGIPHFDQPHAFLPRGHAELRDHAPDVLAALVEAGAEPQDLREKLRGPAEPGDEDLVYLWVRRPLIEWALRRAAAAEPGVELRPGTRIEGLLTEGGRAVGVGLASGEAVRGDVVVDALGRYRAPAGWPRGAGEPSDCGAVYFCRYFELLPGEEHVLGPLLGPRGDLGYTGFNTFRGDNRTFAVILLAPAPDRALRALRHEAAWMAAAGAIRPLDVMTHPEHARPITPVMPMGGLSNVDRTGDPGVPGLVALGDALCHTDPAFSWGLSLSLAQAFALGGAAMAEPDPDGALAAFRDAVVPEARERHALACAMDEARGRRWAGEPLDPGRRDGGCYPLFAFAAALTAAPHDDVVLRRAMRRIGLLDRPGVFDADEEVQERVEAIFARLAADPPPPAGPPRDELLAIIGAAAPG